MHRKLWVAAFATMFTLGSAVSLAAQDLDEVLAKHYDAIGGLDGWNSTQTVSMTGSISLVNGMMMGPFTIVQKRPTLSHMTLTIQGQDIIQAFDGETAWQIVPMMGMTAPTEADPATASDIRDQADFDGPLIGWREDGHKIELVGKTMEGETEYVELSVTLSHGTSARYLLDPETYLPAKIMSSGAAGATTTSLGDYRKVGGLVFPFLIEIDTAMGLNVLTVDGVELNVPVDESIFQMSGS